MANTAVRRPEQHPDPVVRAGWRFAKAFSSGFHRVTLAAPAQLPDEGPAIVASNHISGLDPVLIQSVCPRFITWMMAKEYYDAPGVHWMCRRLGAIPVARQGRDLAALRAALRVLHAGGVIGIFPEGRISPTMSLLPFHPGVAQLALMSGAPIHPACIEGSQRERDMLESYLNPNLATVAFGPPMQLGPAQAENGDLEALAAGIRRQVDALRRRHLGYSPEKL